jgi:Tfp pilus assembly protein PilW
MRGGDVVRLPNARDESGLTLVELLVAILCAVVVIFGLSAILLGVLRGTQRTFTRVNSTEHGRTAIANLENELNSACIGAGETPIQSDVNPTGSSPIWSNATTLQFVSYYGAQASPTPVWHDIVWNSSTNTLTDTTYPVTGGAPEWTRGTSGTTTTLLSNVTQRVSNGTALPVFQYFAYAPGSTDSGGTYWFVHDGATADPVTNQVSSAAALTYVNSTGAAAASSSSSGLSTAAAADAVEIAINLSAGADSENLNSPSLTSANDQISDTISLRLTSPPDQVDTTDSQAAVSSGSVPDGYGPCQ